MQVLSVGKIRPNWGVTTARLHGTPSCWATPGCVASVFWSVCRWRAQREIAERQACPPAWGGMPLCLLAFLLLLLSWFVISFSLPCALVETFLRPEFEKVSLSISLAWHSEINREPCAVYKQTMDWINYGAVYMNGYSNNSSRISVFLIHVLKLCVSY